VIAPLFALAVLTARQAWYGPATVQFAIEVKGNPYDPEANDAWVTFTHGSDIEKRPAYFDRGQWKAVLVAHARGAYRAVLTLNGHGEGSPKQVALTTPMPGGYVRRGGQWGFQFDSGKVYWPLGHDLGWQSGNGFPDMTDFLQTMGKNGINWSRIWACAWDGKNPWWPNDGTKLPIGTFWPKALERWDAIVEAAGKAGIHFQFVLFHHGEFSSTTDSNWKDNPWNTANGGFLSDSVDFFTNERAKRLAQAWIRYAVARWGYSPAIMAWEIFNEVQWTDAINKGHSAEVGRWHDEMAEYIRSLDAAHHLVTTSSEVSLPIWRETDYWQPHAYPPRVEGAVMAMKSPDQRPLFFGEVGPGSLMAGKDVQVEAVRDGIWSGLFALQAGAAEYWTWDLVPKYGLHREYALARKILDESRVLDEKGLARRTVSLGVGAGADLTLNPGGGWEPTRQFDFHLPSDGVAAMGKLSAFFQGKYHADMRPRPVTFHFTAPRAGVFRIEVAGIADSGGELIVKVNGLEAARKSWSAGTKLQTPEAVEAPFPAGTVAVELDNQANDWVQIQSFTVTGIAPEAMALAITNARFALMRIERAVHEGSTSVRLGGLADGTYWGVLTDLDSGSTTRVEVGVSGGHAGTLRVSGRDAILWLRRLK